MSGTWRQEVQEGPRKESGRPAGRQRPHGMVSRPTPTTPSTTKFGNLALAADARRNLNLPSQPWAVAPRAQLILLVLLSMLSQSSANRLAPAQRSSRSCFSLSSRRRHGVFVP
ncbi:hypothetical protein Micbo1qcDRAFT_180463 [Microdochium bolleyi]|uniref:Uncharacterized protein n=1 Tax=Microdochium bolleyi TaxID=196109 RepID=A0A136ILF6_9PEZI|nr:hypothetical protein Micbo1qcDRAFT_180463 [Microdochium bolleyi]